MNNAEIYRNNAKLTSFNGARKVVLLGWVFPQYDWIKCNTNGSCLAGGNQTGCGGMLRDNTGSWVGGFIRDLGTGSVLTAELWVSFLSLKWLGGKGIRKFG